ncbi:outer membrane protein transport protein [Shewanella submarina]|uniref:OmpP1/FadL family transporter n=1 Tax=Shewanella submarina TaxID=2016376 RepID=A0ABV7GBI3_9GAMM|nr:outer membrane protein transport protein [Shewanella submarina]MCL1037011.1 outer membrane protein transport protein [Shewanella submarina]
MNIKTIRASMLLASMVMVTPALATNGYFGHGYGTKNKGLAGAGAALPQDAMIAATNPAGLVFVGERLDLGLAVFSPMRSYEVGGLTAMPVMPPEFPLAEGKVDSDSEYFVIPHFAGNWMLDKDASLGIAVYGNGGMNTDYPGSASGGMGTFYAGPAGVNLEQLFINGSYARKLSGTSSFGISAVFAYQRFKATGLASFGANGLSVDATKLSDNGTDTSTGLGFKLGWQGELLDNLTLAASYQSEMKMTEFEDYSGLFAEGGDFDIPASWTLGLAYQLSSSDVLVFDVQQIFYSDVAAVANPVMPALGLCMQPPFGAGDAGRCLGADNGPGFGWEDMTVYKLGYQWAVSSMPGYLWRAGYSYGEQPIPESEVMFNILAPGVMEQHFTLGMSKSLDDSELTLALMYSPETTVRGINPTVASSNQQIQLQMSQWELELSYSW